MVIAKLFGGLGNQLFQYAAARALAHQNHDSLKIDLSWFQGNQSARDTPRTPDILQLSISANVANAAEIAACKHPWGLVSKGARLVSQKVLKRYFHDWHPEVLHLKGNVYLDGYFQCERYFVNWATQILQEFRLTEDRLAALLPLTQQLEQLPNPVSLHVRRGDYLSAANASTLGNICNARYYQEAMQVMQHQTGPCNWIIFSDDVNWVRENINVGSNAMFISGTQLPTGEALTAPQEIFLMSCCRHHIIANSSFSWWGAYLNSSPNKFVVAPALWSRSQRFHHRHILPSAWTTIPVSQHAA
jgi:hypothetical protein